MFFIFSAGLLCSSKPDVQHGSVAFSFHIKNNKENHSVIILLTFTDLAPGACLVSSFASTAVKQCGFAGKFEEDVPNLNESGDQSITLLKIHGNLQ